jgi:uncharacterized small protein (DUF1192 family)
MSTAAEDRPLTIAALKQNVATERREPSVIVAHATGRKEETEAPRPPQVLVAISELRDRAAALSDALARLEARLDVVLRKREPEPAATTTTGTTEPVALAGAIYQEACEIEFSCTRLTSILDRLEL